MIKVYCFFHSADLDGHCSGAIVRQWAVRNGFEFVPRGVNYGGPVAWMEGAGADNMAVITDFTPESCAVEVLADMRAAYGRGLVWIDHHHTAIDGAGRLGLQFRGIRTVGTAACRLTWDYFFEPDAEPPAVTALGRYDVFDKSDPGEWEGVILPFQYGVRMSRTKPDGTDEPGLWSALLGGEGPVFDDIVRDGRACLRFERENNRKTAFSAAYDCVFEGLPCCAINARGNSLVLDAYARPEHKMRILWAFTGGRWRVSLYENGHADVDCGEIAKRFGGGGHKGAAGFEMSNAQWLSGPVLYPSGGRRDGTQGAGE